MKTPSSTGRVIIALCALLTVICACWLYGDGRRDYENDRHIILAGLFVCFVPGLVVGQLLNYRSRHPWQTAGVAFALSMLVELLIVAPIMAVGGTITSWSILLLAAVALGLGEIARRSARGDALLFLTSLVRLPRGSFGDRLVNLLVIAVPIVVGALAYRWGEPRLMTMGGETLLHISYLRMYHDSPLVFENLGIDRGLSPPNLVHLWEFLLAGWARLSGTDPLPIFFRARAIIPLIGLGSLYWLALGVFQNRRHATAVFLSIAVMAASGLILAGKSMNWINAFDPTRGVLLFYGTSHHADAALDMLLPLGGAAALGFFRRRSLNNALVLVAVLTIAFTMHAREFLQTGYYVGLMLPTILLCAGRAMRSVLRAWGATLGLVAATAIVCVALSATLVSNASHGYDENAIRRRAVESIAQPQNLVGVRNLFHFPYHLMFSSTLDATQIFDEAFMQKYLVRDSYDDPYLYLTAAALVVAALLGRPADRRLALYTYGIWFLTLCWNAGMFAVMALTYSEFYMSTPRLIHIPAYLTIGAALTALASHPTRLLRQALRRVAPSGTLATALGILVCGVAGLLIGERFDGWSRTDAPITAGEPGWTHAEWISVVVPVACLVGLVALYRGVRAPRVALLPAVVLAVTFFKPSLERAHETYQKNHLSKRQPPANWLRHNNVLLVSPGLIDWTRKLPAWTKVFVHPRENEFLSIHAPIYLAVSPCGTVVRDAAEQTAIVEGRHYLYVVPWNDPREGAVSEAAKIDHAEVLRRLRESRVDYLVVSRARYDGYLGAYVRRHPEDYTPVYDNREARELVVAVKRP